MFDGACVVGGRLQSTQSEVELPNPLVMDSLQSFESLGTIKKLVLRMIAFTLEAWQVKSFSLAESAGVAQWSHPYMFESSREP